MIVAVGGSDGAQSLVSTEFYNFESNSWTMGPPLNTPRANLSVVTMGSRLYTVGGFSGKKFLTTLEWLDVDNMEWFGHTPRQAVEEEASGVTVAEVKGLAIGGAANGEDTRAGGDFDVEVQAGNERLTAQVEEEEEDGGGNGQEKKRGGIQDGDDEIVGSRAGPDEGAHIEKSTEEEPVS